MTALPPSRTALAEAAPHDWRWQLQHAARTVAELERLFALTEEERAGAQAAERGGFPLAVTPYYAGLASPTDPSCPIRRQVVPHAREGTSVPGDREDPLGEEEHTVAPELIRRYPDRALLLATDHCAVFCRFCTRSRTVGAGGGARSLERLEPAFAWLRSHPEVREVIVSGGDPLALATPRLVALLERLREIPSLEVLRLATRAPVVLPMRVDDELVAALRRLHPLWVMTHFNHPRELAPEARAACARLVDAGIPVMNQTVLLRGVNDDAEVLTALFRGLVRERVRPYYLLHGDVVRGTGHLRTSLARSVELAGELQGRLSGIALPRLVCDTPGGYGKVPLAPDAVVRRQPGSTTLRTWRGVEVEVLDPPE